MCAYQIANIDTAIQTLSESIENKIDERMRAEEVINWVQSSIPIQSLIVEILDLMPSDLKIKCMSTALMNNQNKIELIVDVLGKKQNSLLFSKKIENLLSSKGYKSSSNSNQELISGNRIIITSLLM